MKCKRTFFLKVWIEPYPLLHFAQNVEPYEKKVNYLINQKTMAKWKLKGIFLDILKKNTKMYQ